MSFSCNPASVLDDALGSSPRSAHTRIAIVLPSTDATLHWANQLNEEKIVVGTAPGMVGMSRALRSAASVCPPSLMLVFADHFSRPADTSILAVLADTHVFLSPLEYILNDKYGYALGIWTSEGVAWLAPGAPIKEILTAMVGYLQDCAGLGHEWMERSSQSLRLPDQRERAARRQLRFLHSSTANVHMDDPENPEARLLLRRIAALGATLEKGRLA